MAVDPRVLLKDVAGQFGKSVRSTSHFDANVCTSPTDHERPWEILSLPGDIFRHKLDIAFAGCKVRLRANGDFVVVEIPSNLDVDVLSINRQDKVFQLDTSPFQIPSFPSLQVFSSTSDGNLRQFLSSPSLMLALSALRLEEAESLHIYRNGPVLYLRPESADEVLSAIETLCSFIKKLPSSEGGVNLNGLPPKFKNLSSLIRKWAMPDDESRSEMLEQKSHVELKRLVAAVEPHIPSINEYLDSFADDTPSEAATALGRLAECATEARIILSETNS